MLRFALSEKTFTYTVVLELSLQQKGTHNICTGLLDSASLFEGKREIMETHLETALSD